MSSEHKEITCMEDDRVIAIMGRAGATAMASRLEGYLDAQSSIDSGHRERALIARYML